MKTALIIIDFQNEFINGKLKINYSENIIKKINKIQSKFDIVCFTKNIFKNINNNELTDIKIKDFGFYCIENSKSSEFPDNLKINTNIFERSYRSYNSDTFCFSSINAKNSHNKTLLDFLKENNIDNIYICGLPGDYSIKDTSLDLIKHFKTYVIIDMIKNLNNNLNDTVNFFLINKIGIINSYDLDMVLKNLNLEKNK